MTSIEDRLRQFYDREIGDRAGRPLGEDREKRLAEFVQLCRRRGLSSVVEVGCGAGRDGTVLATAGLAYQGVDLTRAAVALCRRLGLDAHEASALNLPFPHHAFDAGWCMSTLMHLPDDGMVVALAELKRVIRPGGVLEVGVWGADRDGVRTDPHGRYFLHRTDESLRGLLQAVGELTAFDTWGRHPDGGHYQWARVEVGGPA